MTKISLLSIDLKTRMEFAMEAFCYNITLQVVWCLSYRAIRTFHKSIRMVFVAYNVNG